MSRIKESCDLPLAMHCHATTGLSTATYLKAIESGIDMLDTSISSMSLTYGHSPTETFVSILEDTDRATGLDLDLLEEISLYFHDVRISFIASKIRNTSIPLFAARSTNASITSSA